MTAYQYEDGVLSQSSRSRTWETTLALLCLADHIFDPVSWMSSRYLRGRISWYDAYSWRKIAASYGVALGLGVVTMFGLDGRAQG
jgi:hypothetical protein